MKRKYSDAARIKRSLKDAYIDGLTDDEQAAEAQDWHAEHVPGYEAGGDQHLNDELIPF